ncbi:hypothetical protein A6A03_18115 [Chloroflexus islandicus]|uniref:Plasmid stabilization protein n=1 Tax=Chloroflexus islandicus TaxID=1707952 RepID=A0A178M4H9_9CHLR|nr:hypothetical protein [Chloroflexus islandicus]OAN43660.1 hypothetical protein A6A03_18115 [Chloroflexus islandicus]
MSYDLFLEPEVHAARHTLPGHVRQRIRRIIADLAVTPRPPDSIALNTANIDLRSGIEVRRIRMERWRIIYAVCDDERWMGLGIGVASSSAV